MEKGGFQIPIIQHGVKGQVVSRLPELGSAGQRGWRHWSDSVARLVWSPRIPPPNVVRLHTGVAIVVAALGPF